MEPEFLGASTPTSVTDADSTAERNRARRLLVEQMSKLSEELASLQSRDETEEPKGAVGGRSRSLAETVHHQAGWAGSPTEIEYEATGGRRNIAPSESSLVLAGYKLRDRAARGERDSLRDRDRVTD